MLKTISIDELEVGMNVQDIKLKNSKYKVKNRGKVNSPRTIELLKKQGVDKIVIKLDQEEQLGSDSDIPLAKDSKKAELSKLSTSKSSTKVKPDKVDPSNQNEKNKGDNPTSLSEEFTRSHQLYDEATENVKKLFSEAASGKKLTTENISMLAGEITESVMRNEYAITILTRIRQQSNYQWEHAINTAVLICGFGLYLGMNKDALKKVTLGALFHDIGTARVPTAILDKPSALTPNEMSVMQKHINWGIDMGKRDKLLNSVIIDMMVNHHERLDGTGYPRGVDKSQLSKLARIIAIVDVYDAMTADKPYKKGVQPMAAMRYLLTNKEKFDPELVQQFIKFLGVYPVGTLVHLSNDRLAIVTEGNRDEPLKPMMEIIYSTELNALVKPKHCDLRNTEVSILSAVRSEDYQINLPKLIRTLTL